MDKLGRLTKTEFYELSVCATLWSLFAEDRVYLDFVWLDWDDGPTIAHVAGYCGA